MRTKLKTETTAQRLRASAGDELSLLVQLTRSEKIGTRMLLRNVVEILKDDPSLLVDVVLMLTDPKRNRKGELGREEYLNAYVAVLNADALPGAIVLATGVTEGALKAGFADLLTLTDEAA